MRHTLAVFCLLLAAACTSGPRFSPAGVVLGDGTGAGIRSVALRVHRMEAMSEFYAHAFGVDFEEVDTSGIRSRFGVVDGVTLKLVPLRDGVDFEGFGEVQLGFSVSDIDHVVRVAVTHGGRQEGPIRREPGLLHASVRDPDGNTIELYQHLP